MTIDADRASANATPNSLLSRRAALAGAFRALPAIAGVAALAGPSTASPADPIFAAIQRHKEAWRAFGEVCSITDTVAAREEGREVTAADEAVHEAASDAEYAARDELFQSPAQTAAGMRAFIEHYIEYDVGCMDEVTSAFLEALLESPVLAGQTGENANV